jgi:hypothetical protein
VLGAGRGRRCGPAERLATQASATDVLHQVWTVFSASPTNARTELIEDLVR